MENKKRNDTATLAALKHNVSAAYVRMLIKGARNPKSKKTKAIVETYKAIEQTKAELAQPKEYY